LEVFLMDSRSLGRKSLLAALFFGGVLGSSGCTVAPERITWKPELTLIGPSGATTQASGSLVVETVYLGNDDGVDRRRNIFLYDDKGNYLTHYRNDSMTGIDLPAGRYAVVSAVMFTNKQIQVQIREGCTTRVTLDDLKAAPDAN
jgi:hypothetical protein